MLGTLWYLLPLTMSVAFDPLYGSAALIKHLARGVPPKDDKPGKLLNCRNGNH